MCHFQTYLKAAHFNGRQICVNPSVVNRSYEQNAHTSSTVLTRLEEDKLREKLWKGENSSNSYFQARRSSQLAGDSANKMSISQIKEGISSLGNLTTPPQLHSLQTTPSSLIGYGEPQNNDTMTRGGGPTGSSLIDPTNDMATIRRPLRLEALHTIQSKKLKKKKNAMNGQS